MTSPEDTTLELKCPHPHCAKLVRVRDAVSRIYLHQYDGLREYYACSGFVVNPSARQIEFIRWMCGSLGKGKRDQVLWRLAVKHCPSY